MKKTVSNKIILVIMLFISINSYCQVLQTYIGPYTFGSKSGEATFNYILQNGERVIDGSFTFNCPSEKLVISGKFLKGKRTGTWTTKSNYSTFDGMAVVKSDLKWFKVAEVRPFKETTEIKTENYLNDKLNGLSTTTKTVKNSWGYPAPGGSSISTYNVKKNYNENVLTSIEVNRKKNEKTNLSLKGQYKNDLAEGNWLFNDSKNNYSYSFNNGYLTNYEIKEVGTAKLVGGKKLDDDANVTKFFTQSENSFDVKYLTNYDKDTINATLSVNKINENLSTVQLCVLKKAPANFIDLDLSQFSNAFSDVTPYKDSYSEAFANSASIECQVLSKDYLSIYHDFFFTDVQKEAKFLELATNKKGQFMNFDWESDRFNPNLELYFLQLKSYIYDGNKEGLQNFLNLVSKNYNVFQSLTPQKSSKSDIEKNDNIMFLVALNFKDIPYFHSIVDKYYNEKINGIKWQNYILSQLEFLKATKIIYNKEELLAYFELKENEIKSHNDKSLENIKSIKIGEQVWMSEDLKIIPSHQNYKLVNNNKIQDKKIGDGIILYGLTNDNKNLCPNGWKLPTLSDWKTLIKTLGGDKVVAGDLLMIGKGTGFETNFPSIQLSGDGYKKLSFNLGMGGYITLSSNGNIIEFSFNNVNYQNEYIPCRCIKE